MEGDRVFLLNSNFRSMISHITFYRNKISFSVCHYFSSAYTAPSYHIGGYFLTNTVLRTCRVIKVTLQTFTTTLDTYCCILNCVQAQKYRSEG
jgi:hypothetical protein